MIDHAIDYIPQIFPQDLIDAISAQGSMVDQAIAAAGPSDALQAKYSRIEDELVKVLHKILTHTYPMRLGIYFGEKSEHKLLEGVLMTGAMPLNDQNANGNNAAMPQHQQDHAQRCLDCLLTLSSLPEFVRLPHQNAPGAGQAQVGVIPSYCICLDEHCKRLLAFPFPAPYSFEDICICLLGTTWEAWKADGMLPLVQSIYAAWRWHLVHSEEVLTQLLTNRIAAISMLLDRLTNPYTGLCASRHDRSIDVLLPNRTRLLDTKAAAQLQMPRHLSRLAFITLFETHTKYCEEVKRRALSLEERVATRRGYTRLLKLKNMMKFVTYKKLMQTGPEHTAEPNTPQYHDDYLVLQFELLSVEPDELDGMGMDGWSWLLCSNTDEGVRDVMRFNDLAELPAGKHLHRAAPRWIDPTLSSNNCVLAMRKGAHGANLISLAVAVRPDKTQLQWDTAAGRTRIVTATAGAINLQVGGEYILQPRFIDSNTNKLVYRMREDAKIDTPVAQPVAAAAAAGVAAGGGDGTLMRQIVTDTINFGTRPPARDVGQWSEVSSALAIPQLCLMTQSQDCVYEHMRTKALTIVWGPPGAGKTYFLSCSICRLLISSYHQDKPMRILVSAFNHPSMDLLLTAIANKLDEWWCAAGLVEDDKPQVMKLGGPAGLCEAGAIVKETDPVTKERLYYRVLRTLDDNKVEVERVHWVFGSQWMRHPQQPGKRRRRDREECLQVKPCLFLRHQRTEPESSEQATIRVRYDMLSSG